jgi:hypothetical protein
MQIMENQFNVTHKEIVEEDKNKIDEGVKNLFAEASGEYAESSNSPSLDEQDKNFGDDEKLNKE